MPRADQEYRDIGRSKVETPVALKEHESKYANKAWMQYSLQELGNWVHLLATRAGHRTNVEKKKKDLHDARNYWRMMGAHLDALETDI